MSKTKKWTLVSAITGTVVVLAIAGVWLFGGSTVVRAAEGLGATILQHRGGPGDRGVMGGDIDHGQRLADALGITVHELEAAQETAHEAAIAQAIEDGVITQEQADEMQAQRELHESLMAYIDRDALMAQAMGMTAEELQAAFDAGKTIPDLLVERGLDAETLHENMAAAHEAALAQAVEDGVITQEQADEMQDGRGMMPGGRMMPSGEGRRPRGRGGFDRGMPKGDDVDGTHFRFPNRSPSVRGSDA